MTAVSWIVLAALILALLTGPTVAARLDRRRARRFDAELDERFRPHDHRGGAR